MTLVFIHILNFGDRFYKINAKSLISLKIDNCSLKLQ